MGIKIVLIHEVLFFRSHDVSFLTLLCFYFVFLLMLSLFLVTQRAEE